MHSATTVQHDSKSQGPAQGSALQVGQPVVVVVVVVLVLVDISSDLYAG